jgi:hypothetical protein
MRRLLTVLAALCLLSMPSAALAQSAGDEQYSDPFGGTEEPSGSQDQPADAPAAEPAPAEPAAPTTSGGEATASQQSGPTLPTTGLPAAALAGAGALLLAGGTGLRRRVS